MISWFLWAALVHAQTVPGHDAFGRPCALRLGVRPDSRMGAMVEDVWYEGARASSGLLHAADGTPADFELHVGRGPAWFRLTLASASGFAHVCRLGG